MFMLGLAFQSGAIPLARGAIEKAIELNGVDVAMNKAAFAWGRRASIEPATVAAIAASRSGRSGDQPVRTLDELVARRVGFLTAYQDAAYAARYRRGVERIREAEARLVAGRDDLAQVVAVNLFKLMAIKDEYEVARLFTDGSFERQLRGDYASWERLEFHLAPPIFAKREPATGRLKKKTYGPRMMTAFRLLARLKALRGSWLDPFGYSAERRKERRLLAAYEAELDEIFERLNTDNHAAAVALASYPEKIRGFGHVKEEAARRAEAEAAIRRDAFLAGRTKIAVAAE
jgi:indolepyruvate ferredoxin oxidoreductase